MTLEAYRADNRRYARALYRAHDDGFGWPFWVCMFLAGAIP